MEKVHNASEYIHNVEIQPFNFHFPIVSSFKKVSCMVQTRLLVRRWSVRILVEIPVILGEGFDYFHRPYKQIPAQTSNSPWPLPDPLQFNIHQSSYHCYYIPWDIASISK